MADAQYWLGMALVNAGQAARREEAVAGVPEARADRPVRRHRQGDARDDQVAMPPSAVIAEQLDAVRRRLECGGATRPPQSRRHPARRRLQDVRRGRSCAPPRPPASATSARTASRKGSTRSTRSRDLALDWHLIGHLQSNKARKAAAAFAWIESVDSVDLLKKLDAGRGRRGHAADDSRAGRSGARGDEVRRRRARRSRDLVKAALDAARADARGPDDRAAVPDQPRGLAAVVPAAARAARRSRRERRAGRAARRSSRWA